MVEPMGQPKKGPGLLSSLAIIIVAAAVTGAAVVGLVAYERGWGRNQTVDLDLLVEEANDVEPDVVPGFTFTDQFGKTFTSDMLKGKVWIADFGFTRCRGVCPTMVAGLREIVDTLVLMPYWDDIRIIRFTVDPEYDTPEVNREYFESQILSAFFEDKHETISEHWRMLTGDKDKLWSLSEDGFKLPVEDAPENIDMPISHSSRYALVNGQGQILGYYNSLEDEERTKLLLDIHELLSDEPTESN